MVELVVSLVIATIVAGFVAMTMTTPVDSYLAQTRRAELSDSAESAMRTIARDVRTALPDSLRAGVVNGAAVLEMIEVSASAGYRQWTIGDALLINAPDNTFDVAGAQFSGRPRNRLVVGASKSDPTYDPYGSSGVMSPAGVNVDFANGKFSLASPHTFPRNSPSQRAYAVVGTTRFECDTAAGVLRRYDSLNISSAMNPVGGAGSIVARDVTACSFRTVGSAAEHGGIAIVEVTVSRPAGGNVESLKVVRQLRVENRP